MVQKSSNFFKPNAELNAAYASKRANPQLWGRMPHMRKALKMAAKLAKLPLPGLSAKPMGQSVKPPQPVIPRAGGEISSKAPPLLDVSKLPKPGIQMGSLIGPKKI